MTWYDERPVGTEPTESKAMLDEHVAVLVRDLVPMAMAFAHFGHTIHLGGLASAREPARIRAKPHGAAHVRDVLLAFHQADHRIFALRRELARMAVIQLEDVSRELDDGCLHAEADAEERQARLTRCANGFHHAFHAADTESARHEEAVIRAQNLARPITARKQVTREPGDVHADVIPNAAVDQGFLHALVAVHELRVLTNHGDAHAVTWRNYPVHHRAPAREVGGLPLQLEALHDPFVQP